MVKRKKRKQKRKEFSFSFRSSRKKNAKERNRFNPVSLANRWSFAGLLKFAVVLCFLTAVGFGLFFLEGYVETIVPVAKSTGLLELADCPDWVSRELRERIISVAGGGQSSFQLDDDTARLIAENLALTAWLAGFQVQNTGRSIQIKAEFRKPVALIDVGPEKFYVDNNLVVLDYIPMPRLPIVSVKGLKKMTVPPVGRPWQRDDLQAAVELLALLHKMDTMVSAKRPLIDEIQAVDVSNFRGRRNRREPHILLYADDDTQVIWGAELGSSQQFMEAREDEKLAMLYSFYEENGTLANRVKYIELRYPRKNIPQPVNSF